MVPDNPIALRECSLCLSLLVILLFLEVLQVGHILSAIAKEQLSAYSVDSVYLSLAVTLLAGSSNRPWLKELRLRTAARAKFLRGSTWAAQLVTKLALKNA